jgi:hypothetical protein
MKGVVINRLKSKTSKRKVVKVCENIAKKEVKVKARKDSNKAMREKRTILEKVRLGATSYPRVPFGARRLLQ